MPFKNCYEDTTRADAYAQLEFANTYHLAYRDLPAIVREHVKGKRALDFGCGTGRSTRFIRQLGLEAVGVDISPAMIAKARELDAAGAYCLAEGDDLSELEQDRFDLVLCAFTFDNIPQPGKVPLFRALGGLLSGSGVLINLVSSPEMYVHEWASFSTKDYPENRSARSGDIVRIVTTDFADRRPAEDIFCTHECYLDLYARAGLKVVAEYRPLATGREDYRWGAETTIAPWVIYVLTREARVTRA